MKKLSKIILVILILIAVGSISLGIFIAFNDKESEKKNSGNEVKNNNGDKTNEIDDEGGNTIILGDKTYTFTMSSGSIVIGGQKFNYPNADMIICMETVIIRSNDKMIIVDKKLNIVFEKSNISFGRDISVINEDDFVNQETGIIVFYQNTEVNNVYEKYQMIYNENINKFGEPIFLEQINDEK